MNTLIVFLLSGVTAAGCFWGAHRLGKRGALALFGAAALAACLGVPLLLQQRPWMARRVPAACAGVLAGAAAAEGLRQRRRGRQVASGERRMVAGGEAEEAVVPTSSLAMRWTAAGAPPAALGAALPGPRPPLPASHTARAASTQAAAVAIARTEDGA